MIVYHYDPDTFIYLNTASEADPDPLDPDHWLIPANATQLVPPAVADPKKQRQVWHDYKWVIEDIPLPPVIHTNIAEAPEKLWPRMSIKEALKGGVT